MLAKVHSQVQTTDSIVIELSSVLIQDTQDLSVVL